MKTEGEPREVLKPVAVRVITGGSLIAVCISFPRELFARTGNDEVMEVQAVLDARQAGELGSVLLRASGAAEVPKAAGSAVLRPTSAGLDAAKLN